MPDHRTADHDQPLDPFAAYFAELQGPARPSDKRVDAAPPRTTYSRHLSGVEPLAGDAGPEAFIHRPAERVPAAFVKKFTVDPYPRLSPAALEALRHGAQYFEHRFGSVQLEFDAARGEAGVIVRGSDPARVARNLDFLKVAVGIAPDGQITRMRIQRGIGIENLTRSMLAILLGDSPFAAAHPELYAALKAQFALEPATDSLRRREMNAYSRFDLIALAKMIEERDFTAAHAAITAMIFSKSQEMRRVGVTYMEYLHEQGGVEPRAVQAARRAAHREDVREDLVFITRSLKNDIDWHSGGFPFVAQTFEHLFNRRIDREAALGSTVTARYFARGCNKQVYVIDWAFPDRSTHRFAIAAIRDAQLGQGDFDEARISDATARWRDLSALGGTDVAAFGSTVWHMDWRSRELHLQGLRSPLVQRVKNNFLLMSREFVEGTPLNLLLVGDAPEEEKAQALEVAATAYLRVWFVSHARTGSGMYFTTPRAEDIVMRRDADGTLRGTIVDPDTLSSGSLEDAVAQFKTYHYYSDDLLQKVVAGLRKEFA